MEASRGRKLAWYQRRFTGAPIPWLLPVIVVIGIFYLPAEPATRNLTATVLFVAVALTDWADGWLARRLNQTSSFGAFLDPVADKLMVTAALLSLLALGRVADLIALVIIGREITISALREWMAQIGASKSVAVNFLGKLKTTVQMIAIPLLLFNDSLFGIDASLLGGWMIYLAAVLTLWSMFYYMKLAWPQIRERSNVTGGAGAQK